MTVNALLQLGLYLGVLLACVKPLGLLHGQGLLRERTVPGPIPGSRWNDCCTGSAASTRPAR